MSARRSPYAPDRPHDLRGPDADVFGHGDYADALVDALTKADTPFTVGVFGEWGVGKSTIITAVKERLPGDVAFAFFDAWRYEGEALRRQFLRDIARQLDEAKQLRGFDVKKELRDLDVEVATPEESGLSISGPEVIRGLVSLLVGVALVFSLLRVRATGNFFTGKDAPTDAVLALVSSLILAVIATVVQPLKVVQRTLTARRVEEPDQFTAKFEELMGAVQVRRVVIAIDNLDRCSPEHAVEVLSTIKTYLEPSLEQDDTRRLLARFFSAKPPKEAVFLIAADSAALRRHLVGQETQRSEGRDVHDVERYVDEYLRKFFSATIPVRSLLDEDLRAFVESHLRNVVDVHGKTELLPVLAQMCAAGLRANPRRVKQFANNLELRLNLLAAREKPDATGRRKIDPPISGNLLMVAKLLMIEEEWPARFAQLQASPRLLADWERRAFQRDGEDASPDERSDVAASADDDWPRFAAFLRLSSDVRAANIRAFLFLKQSQEEVTLPGFEAFRALVVADDRDGIRELINETGQPAADYAQRLPHILQLETRERYLEGARAVLDVAVSIGVFAALPVAGEVVTQALADPGLRSELVKLDATAVLGVTARRLSADRRRDAEVLFATAFETEIREQAPSGMAGRVAELSTALADVDGLSTAAKERLASGISAHPDSFKMFSSLLFAQPDLLTADVGDIAVRAAIAGDPPTSGELSDDHEALRVTELALEGESVSQEMQDALLVRFRELLTPAVLGDGDVLRPLLTRQGALLMHMRSATDEALAALFRHLDGVAPPADPETRLGLLAFRHQVVAPIVDAQLRADLSGVAAAQLFVPEPTVGLQLIVERPNEIPFRPFIEGQLLAVARTLAVSVQAARTIAAYSSNAADGLGDVIAFLIEQQQYALADEAVRDVRGHLGAVGASLVTAALDAATHPPINLALLPLLTALSDFLVEEQTPQVHELLTRLVDTLDPTPCAAAFAAFAELEGRSAFASAVGPFTEHVLGRLEAIQDFQPAQIELLWNFLVARYSRLSAEQRMRLLDCVGRWADHADTHWSILGLGVTTLAEQLVPAEREALVGHLLAAEGAANQPPPSRQALLVAAATVGHDGRSRSGRAVRARLTELETSDDPSGSAVAGPARVQLGT